MLTQSNDWKEQLPATIERLRSSKNSFDAKEKECGIRDGRDWALNSADFLELIKLQSAGEVSSLDQLLHVFREEGFDREYFFGPAEFDDLAEIPDSRVQGFVEGALEVFEEVKDHI